MPSASFPKETLFACQGLERARGRGIAMLVRSCIGIGCGGTNRAAARRRSCLVRKPAGDGARPPPSGSLVLVMVLDPWTGVQLLAGRGRCQTRLRPVYAPVHVATGLLFPESVVWAVHLLIRTRAGSCLPFVSLPMECIYSYGGCLCCCSIIHSSCPVSIFRLFLCSISHLVLVFPLVYCFHWPII